MHVCVFMIAAVIIHQMAAFHDTLLPLALQFFPPSLLCSVGFGRGSVNGDVSFVLSAHQSLSPSSLIRGLFVLFFFTNHQPPQKGAAFSRAETYMRSQFDNIFTQENNVSVFLLGPGCPQS